MSWLSEHRLVAAISEAGGFGVLAAGNLPVATLREEIHATRLRTQQPFGVNLITLNPQLDALIDLVIQEQITHVVLAGGLPDPHAIERLKKANIRVLLFAPSLALAKRLTRSGADALIIEGHEAGGHVGPVATGILIQEIMPHMPDATIFVAGGIATGAMVAALVGLGASGCQLGTRFVCTEECVAHPHFKRAFIRAQARDAVVTAQFDPALPVIPVRALANKSTQAFNTLQLQLVQEVKAGRKERMAAILEMEHFWVGALRKAAIEGDVEQGSVMAGQSVGLVKSIQPVAEVMAELVREVEQTLATT